MFLVWGGGKIFGSTRLGFMGLGAAALTFMAAFFLGFPVAVLGPAVVLV